MNVKEYGKLCCETVTVCPDFESDLKVSPLLFGNNLEHTRSCVHTGISAQMLRNRKFAGKPACYTGCPDAWYKIGEKTSIVFNENEDGHDYPTTQSYTRHAEDYHMKRRHECNAVTLVGYQNGEVCGLGQKDIAVEADTTYECRLVVKVWKPTEVCVALTNRDGKVYDQKELLFDKKEYESKTVIFNISKRDEQAKFTITFKGSAAVCIGAVSLLPEKNFHGMRLDVVELLREIGVKLLRWPGGNFAGEYNWKDGLLPCDMRAPLQSYMGIETQAHSMGYDYSELNTDDFIALCKEIGAEPFITINPTWNTKEECAQWLEYCNGGADTEYGRLRMERGFVEPYHVKFWSLGNEFGYGHMEGDNSSKGYGKMGLEFGKKMLETDPSITLCSSGPYPNQDWAEHAAKPLGKIAPLVSLHTYIQQPIYVEPEKYEEEYYECIDKVDSQARALVRQQRAELGDDSLRISFDEWNVWYGWYRPKSVSDGIFTASMFHMLIEEAAPCGMDVACHFEAVNEGAIRVEWDKAFLTASGQMFAVMKNHIDGKLCFTSKDAVVTERDGVLTITLINRSYDGCKKFELPKYGENVGAKLYEGESVLPYSDFIVKDAVLTEKGEGYETVLPKYSVMMVQMKK